jgi:hypothetical protein
MPWRAVCDPDGEVWATGKFSRMDRVDWKGDAYYAAYHLGQAPFEP